MSRVQGSLLTLVIAAGLLAGLSLGTFAQQVPAILWRGTPSEQAAVVGLRDGLKEFGLAGALEVVTVSAEGKAEEARALLTKAAAAYPPMIIAVGAPVAQQAVQITATIPIVYLNVYDPVGQKVIADWVDSGNNSVGVANTVPLRRRMEYARTLFPEAQLWLVVAGSDPEALAQAAEIVALGPELGLFDVSVAQGATPQELVARAKEGIGDAGLIFLVDDGLVEQAAAEIVAAAGKKPVIGSSTASLEAGALAALAVDYSEAGRQAAQLLSQIFTGTSTSSIPSETPNRVEFIINLRTARERGFNLSLELLGAADQVIE